MAVATIAALTYLTGVRRLARRGRVWPAFRTTVFLAGLVTVALALASPVSTLVASSFEYHVVQHMLLMVVAAPLLALSAPMTLALQTSHHDTKVVLLRVLRTETFAALTFPVTVWFLYYGVMFAFFLTPLIGYRHEPHGAHGRCSTCCSSWAAATSGGRPSASTTTPGGR